MSDAASGAEGASIEELMLDLLRKLETIGDRDDSLFDSTVRMAMSDAIFFLFIRPKPGYRLPDDYGLPDESNRAIRDALGAYIDGALALAPALGLDTVHKRLAAFQNGEVHTEQEMFSYVDFFGHCNPKQFDDGGNTILSE